MVSIPGFRIIDQLYDTPHTHVYRALRDVDQMPVVLKVLSKENPSQEDVNRFGREVEIIELLAGNHVIKSYGKQTLGDSVVIILEDIGGTSINLFSKISEIPLDEALELLVQITGGVEQLHLTHIIHKDINPANIVWNRSAKQVKLIDFGISSLIPKESLAIKRPEVLEGTLAYMSPEQTGRMNRALDYRSDFYSLGVTFYYILTGELPYSCADPMELVHNHIAKKPLTPHERKHDIPEVLSELVMKLMSKNAEERYQSAQGIIVDLTHCLLQFETNGEVAPFILGQKDVSHLFHIPQKLYGREKEITILLAAFERISHGEKEMLMAIGYSGIGKSSLVQEVNKPITQKNGYFIAGKFGQFERNKPYSAFIMAFKELIRQLLTESESLLSSWSANLTLALGVNAKLIVDVIPDLELIIGPQASVPHLSAVEAQNRFNLTFNKFIRVLATEKHPLVIFVDDLQWADLASLQLMRLVMLSPDISHLLFIGAYRDNEVSQTHPLILTLDEIEQSGVLSERLDIGPLTTNDLNCLIQDALLCDKSSAKGLTALVHDKTGGNPFFVNQFLLRLFEDQLIQFSRADSRWIWNTKKIESTNITDNVVELMVKKLRKLPNDTQKTLNIAAFIGSSFNLEILSVAMKKPAWEVARSLKRAVLDSFILSASNFSFSMTDIDSLRANHHDGKNYQFKFSHDRVQQAAYNLIDDAARQKTHVGIGRVLIEYYSSEDLHDNVFNVVNHLNQGVSLITQADEQEMLAQLNLEAGLKAKDSVAYAPAYGYLKNGLQLLQKDAWKTQYELAYTMHKAALEAAYLCADFDAMNDISVRVLAQCKTAREKADVYAYIVQGYHAKNETFRAIEEGLHGIRLMGKNFPRRPKKVHIVLSVLLTKVVMRGNAIDNLLHKHEAENPDYIAIAGVGANVSTCAYNASPRLLPLMILWTLRASNRYGILPQTAFGLCAYGMILCGALLDIEQGCHAGEVALKLAERPSQKNTAPRTQFLFDYMIRPWKHHINSSIAPLIETYQNALEVGDFEFASLSVNGSCLFSYMSGKPLDKTEWETRMYSRQIKQLQQQTPLNYHNILHQAMLNLMGKNDDPCEFEGTVYSESEMMPIHIEANDQTAIFAVLCHKLTLCYSMEEYEKALICVTEIPKYIDSVLGTYFVPLYSFFSALTKLAIYPSSSRQKQRSILRSVTRYMRNWKVWVNHAPMNFANKMFLIEAEIARVKGDAESAIRNYGMAINLSKENGFLHEEAISYELFAKFLFSKEGLDEIALPYLIQALDCYKRWGAIAKVDQINRKYSRYLIHSVKKDSYSAQQYAYLPATQSITSGSETLDLSSVMKASNSISGEIVLTKLLKTLMSIVMENAGAERGFMILNKNEILTIDAKSDVATNDVEVLQNVAVDDSNEVPGSVIHFAVRTKEPLLIGNAKTEERFSQDPYIRENKPVSIMCLPLFNQNKLSAVFYLENNLSVDVFTEDRIRVLKMLSSQIAISIDNARLYGELSSKNIQITNLLKATTEMSKATSKVDAASVAMHHLADLDNNIDLSQVELFLLQQNAEHYIGYTLWKSSQQISAPSPYQLSPIRNKNIIDHGNISFRDNCLTFKVKSDKKDFAVIEIRHYHGRFSQIEETKKLVEGISGSLALTMENMEAEENTRLSGIGAMAASIIHDLKNPISVILGYAELAGEDLLTLPERKGYLDIISNEAARLSAMAHQVLEYSRGEIELDLQTVDSDQYINDVSKVLRPLFEQNGMSFRLDIQYHGEFTIDADRIRRVLLNLAINAKEAMTEQPKKSTFKLSVIQSNNNIQLIAEDNGPGIPDEIKTTLFEPFVTSGKVSGTGFGMSIVKKMVEAHNGEISFQSSPEEGTVFTLTLPMIQIVRTEREISPSLKLDSAPVGEIEAIRSGTSILVAEGNPVNQKMIAALLESIGYQCDVVGSGHMALDALESKYYDLVLMDVEMPGLNGNDTTMTIRKTQSAFQHIPIVALVTSSSEEDRHHCFASGVNEIVSKPIKFDTLANTLVALIGGPGAS